MKRSAIANTALTAVLTAGATYSLAGSNTVTTDDIATNNVTNTDIGTNAVTGNKVAPDTLTGIDINESTLAIPTLRAYVGATGELVANRSSRAISANRAAGYVAGGYEVAFDRDVSNCTNQVTPYSAAVIVRAQPRSGVPNKVLVLTTSPSNGAYTDASFDLTVTC
jgi:hypothetical protein